MGGDRMECALRLCFERLRLNGWSECGAQLYLRDLRVNENSLRRTSRQLRVTIVASSNGQEQGPCKKCRQ
jgi:hypothetical protein